MLAVTPSSAQKLRIGGRSYQLDNVKLNLGERLFGYYENGDNYLQLFDVPGMEFYDTLQARTPHFGSHNFGPYLNVAALTLVFKNTDSIAAKFGFSIGLSYDYEYSYYNFGDKRGLPSFTRPFAYQYKDTAKAEIVTELFYGTVTSRVSYLGFHPRITYRHALGGRWALGCLAGPSVIVSVNNDFNQLKINHVRYVQDANSQEIKQSQDFSSITNEPPRNIIFYSISAELGANISYRISPRFSAGIEYEAGITYMNHERYDFWSNTHRYTLFGAYHFNAKGIKLPRKNRSK